MIHRIRELKIEMDGLRRRNDPDIVLLQNRIRELKIEMDGLLNEIRNLKNREHRNTAIAVIGSIFAGIIVHVVIRYSEGYL
jgi:hypothetical protein